MYGGDLMMLRPVELQLLSNQEVLEVNQNSTNNHQLLHKGEQLAWIADVPNSGDKYLAVFNLANHSSEIPVSLNDLGFHTDVEIRDLWQHQDLGNQKGSFAPEINAHGSGLYRISQKKN